MVIYEWGDMPFLGKVTSTVNDMPVSDSSYFRSPRVQRKVHSRKHTSALLMRLEVVIAPTPSSEDLL